MVLGVLAIVWVVVLGSYARERFADRHRDSVSAFRSQLSTLQRTHPGHLRGMARPDQYRRGAGGPGVAPGIGCEVARQRRKTVMVALLSVAMLALLSVVTVGGAVAVVFALTSIAALVGYVVLLVDRQRVIAEQRAKVRPIRTPNRPPVSGVTATRRVAATATPRR